VKVVTIEQRPVSYQSVKRIVHFCSALAFALGILCGAVSAQSNSNAPSTTATEDANKPAVNLIEATEQYKNSSQKLVTLQQNEFDKAKAKLEELRKLAAEGLIARTELEANEQSLVVLGEQLRATQQQIADSDHMIAEIRAEQQLAKSKPANIKLVLKSYKGLNTNATMLRYNGAGSWSLAQLGALQSFFSSTFGRSLPTSAVGQSSTHNRLGYDHRNAVDVAVHPDSAEGRTLIRFLQEHAIPFLAFRGAIPGVATGPHIHVGSASHRLS
jgi:hypothetical protein